MVRLWLSLIANNRGAYGGGSADEQNRQRASHQLVAAAGEDGRFADQARTVPLASYQKVFDAETIRRDGPADRVAALACRVDEPANGRFHPEQRRGREKCRRNRSKGGPLRALGGSVELKPACSVAPSSSDLAAGCIRGVRVVRYRCS
jgi:hypothetical protein